MYPSDVLKVIPRRVSAEMNRALMFPFREAEIIATIKEIFPALAPGHDGFPALFYLSFWENLGPKTIASCLDMLNRKKSIQG